MTKPYKTFGEQAHILVMRGMQSIRNLTADALEKEIESKLRYINYYRIAPYWSSFLERSKDENEPHFHHQTYWETVMTLYNFDRDLRGLFFRAFSEMEPALRTQVAHQWARYTGSTTPQADRKGLRPSFCTVTPPAEDRSAENDGSENGISVYDRIMERLADNFRKDRSLYAAWDRDIKQGATIETVPVWSFVEFANFGHIAELLKRGLEEELVQKIAEAMQFDSLNYFLFGIALLAQIRNACAHQFRVWNYHWISIKYQMAPEDVRTELNRLVIPSGTGAALTFCYKMLRAGGSSETWKTQLIHTYQTAAMVVPTLHRDLGFFSPNWYHDPRWNLS